ncbi:flocculation protein FLO11-like [Stegodyphus dumicola]|uniref:flocculation protein FLO11-like n=1 Tax=Stegodyphus dumicola TaxID=202533 RepID=UPI0015A9EE82|nr:flocculation protein FLO11-like [Stegodyphus dumicola]
MRFSWFAIVFIIIVPEYSCLSSSVLETSNNNHKSTRTFETNGRFRRKREADEEDVINRFEMERVSPLYDIVRHLPPFEEEWIPSPITTTTLTPEVSARTSSTTEIKIDVSRDEDHVVSESGRQYGGNSARSWFYSAESFSSSSHFDLTNTELEEGSKFYTKVSTSRRQDEDHVMSQSPGLMTSRISLLDEVVVESPTTPFINVTVTPKVQEEKPNITTRYILLQSGRIVAINVTSVSSAFKTSGGGSSSKPFSPTRTIYFGSRLKTQNNTTSVNISNVNRLMSGQSTFSSTPSTPIRVQTEKISDALKNKQSPTKKLITTSKKPTTEIPKESARLVHKQRHSSTATLLVTNPPKTTALRSFVEYSNVRYTSGDTIEKIFDLLQPDTTDIPFFVITFDSLKRNQQESPNLTETTFSGSTTKTPDHEQKSRNLKYNEPIILQKPPQLQEQDAFLNSREKVAKNSGISSVQRKESVTNNRGSSTYTPLSRELLTTVPFTNSPAVKDGVAPLLKIRHEFLRIVPITPVTATDIPTTTTSIIKPDRNSSRRPRYRGLSHVSLQAPRKHKTETPVPNLATTTAIPKTPSTTFKKPRQQQSFHFRNSVSFQTMPPSAFSDRRSLSGEITTEISELSSTSKIRMPEEVEYIFRFEPTRKSMNNKNSLKDITTDIPSIKIPTTVRTRVDNRWKVIPNQMSARTTPLSITSSSKDFRTTVGSISTTTATTSSNRVGRNFKQSVTEIQDVDTITTTKMPFRVYYFEPKRKKAKISLKDKVSEISETLLTTENIRTFPTTASKWARVTSPTSRGNVVYRDSRRLLLPPESQDSTTESFQTTSTRPTAKRIRHSPFIWHRPNVATKPPSSTETTANMSNSTISENERRAKALEDFVYLPINLQRTA